ncbi:hypothetical protein [Priestia megaterium]|uniref:hypothetical protein n=1 Tax=Priestia megaterium TaxID=1404 RepID=UPI002E1EF1CC|nr:hypothetical protein [Priestia megaterium]
MSNNLKLPVEVKDAIRLFRKHNPIFDQADDTTVLMYALDYSTAHLLKDRKDQKLLH